MDLEGELKKIIRGDVDTSAATRAYYSHDASLFESMPQAVVFPKTGADIEALVAFVQHHKAQFPMLSLTARSRGTDMSGGVINDSIIIDTSRYMTGISDVSAAHATAQSGVAYRDFEIETLKYDAIMPAYPASREIAGIGGIINNNAGGEYSLAFGKADRYIASMDIVLSDGHTYTIGPLTRTELNVKMDEDTFEGRLYRDTFELLDRHYDEIKAATPKVSKDSTGYHLWDVWDREKGIFDLTKLFVGSQGTLGMMTKATLSLVRKPTHTGTLVCYLESLDRLGEIIPAVLEEQPVAFECFDDNTLRLGRKLIGRRLRGTPKMVLLIEFAGSSEAEVKRKMHAARTHLTRFHFRYLEEDEDGVGANLFWRVRRESFNLLRKQAKDTYAAPFIDDFVVPPARLAEFLPQLRNIIKKYKLLATIAGHLGDGNFHVVPLMKIDKPAERAKFAPAMKEVNMLVIKYGGSISGEHNDGLIRGPWLSQMYSPAILGYMKEIKQFYDPLGIFNPHKKTDATWDYSAAHLRERF